MSVLPKIDLGQAETLGNRIVKQINALREVSPIFWSEPDQSWILTGHAEVAEAFRGTLPLSAGRYKMFEILVPDEAERKQLIPNLIKYFPSFLINLDPPEHTRLRTLMLKAFGRPVAEAYRPHARDVIKTTLDKFRGRNEVEFVEEIARQITARNIMRMMGLEDEEFYLPRLKEWSYLSGAGLTGRPSREMLARVDRSFGEIATVMQAEIDRRRKAPGTDFVSMLVHAEVDGDRFTDVELIGNLRLILMAGHDTTLNTMALSINALARDDEARSYVRSHPESILNSVMELMRFIAMSTEQTRVVAKDFEWKGHHLKAGQLVRIMIAGANRDPRVFAEPERLDFARNQDNNMTFGPGMHHCIGHFFAKMQLTEFFPEFLSRYESFDVLDEDLNFSSSLTFRGLQALHLRLHPSKS